MGLSVSRIIWIKDDILEIKRCQRSTAVWEVVSFIKKIPKGTHYKVIYILDSKGLLLVTKRKIMIVSHIRTKNDMGVCFLPKSWDGKRVRRKVEVPIYENSR